MELITILVELGFTPLNILLVVMLYFVLAKQGVLPKVWKGGDGDDTPKWASHLLQYYNHDTTAAHDLTHSKLDRIENKMDEHNKIEVSNSGKLDEIIRAVNR